LLFRTSNENPLTYAKKVIDSLINEEALWVTNEEKLDEKKAPWLDTSLIADGPSFFATLCVERHSTENGKKVNDYFIDEEAFWLTYVEALDEIKWSWLVNSATAAALVARDRAGVSDTLTDMLSEWPDAFVSVGDGDIDENKYIVVWCDGY